MPPDDALEVTAVVVNRNGMSTLPRTLNSLTEGGVALAGIIVADDGSTDGTPEWVERNYPQARVIRLPHTGRANIARNAGLRAVPTPYAFLTDNDITVLPGSLARLLETLKARHGILCVTPRLLDDRRNEIIYADGNSLHFLGLSGASARGANVASHPPQPPFATFGGGIMLIRMSHACATGLMDEGLFQGWASDAEFQLRGRLLGFEALHDSHAAMLHEDKHHHSSRAFGQTANRYRVLLSAYSWKTLLLLAPSLLAFELALTVASLRLGVSAERWRAVRHVWSTRREILAKRAVLRSRRRVGDRALLVGGSFQLPGIVHRSGFTGLVLATAQWLFTLNWRAVRRWL